MIDVFSMVQYSDEPGQQLSECSKLAKLDRNRIDQIDTWIREQATEIHSGRKRHRCYQQDPHVQQSGNDPISTSG